MKVRREKERLGCVLLAERDAKVQNLTCVGFDSKKDQKVPVMCLIQCFGSIFIESGSGSSQKSQSGSGSRKGLNLDPVPSYFLTLSEEKKIFFIIISFYHQKKSIKRMLKKSLNGKIMSWIFNIFDLILSPWIRIRIPNQDPDPEDPLNPDPDPKHWFNLLFKHLTVLQRRAFSKSRINSSFA